MSTVGRPCFHFCEVHRTFAKECEDIVSFVCVRVIAVCVCVHLCYIVSVCNYYSPAPMTEARKL